MTFGLLSPRQKFCAPREFWPNDPNPVPMVFLPHLTGFMYGKPDDIIRQQLNSCHIAAEGDADGVRAIIKEIARNSAYRPVESHGIGSTKPLIRNGGRRREVATGENFGSQLVEEMNA